MKHFYPLKLVGKQLNTLQESIEKMIALLVTNHLNQLQYVFSMNSWPTLLGKCADGIRASTK